MCILNTNIVVYYNFQEKYLWYASPQTYALINSRLAKSLNIQENNLMKPISK